MKKILFLTLICGSILSVSAQVVPVPPPVTAAPEVTTVPTTTITHKYYYYPTSNMYYDESTGDYWQHDNTSGQWTQTHTLPATVTVEKTPKYPITYTGTDNQPWKDNASDIRKYKVRKNGTVKIKKK